MTTDPGSGPPVSGPTDGGGSERLQALLAQASQGQREEQREITNSLTEMRNQLQRLGQEIAELRAAPSADSGDGAAINNVTVELREAVRFLSDRLDGVTRMVAQRGEELADIRAALSAIDAHVRSQAETIGVLSTGLQALPSYGERVSGLQEHIDAVAQRLTGVETAVSRPAADSGVNNRLAAIEASLTPLGEQVAGATQAAAEHRSALAETAASLQALHGKLDSLEAGTQAALATPPSFDDSAITALDQRLAAVGSDLSTLREQVSGLATEAAPAAAGAITEDDLERAMRASEDRLRSHVDDAVIALAEALLRPRSAAAPSAAAPEESPAALAESASTEDQGADQDADQESDQESDQGAGHWWERENFTASTTSSAPRMPTLEEEMATAEAGAIDFSRAEMVDEGDDDEADGVDGDDADDDADADADAYEADEADGADEADDGVEVAGDEVEAADSAPPGPPGPPVFLLPPPLSAEDAVPGASDPLEDTASWSPEVPGARPEPPDPDSSTIIPERKGRFFGRGNKK